jgi:hypothetical protein
MPPFPSPHSARSFSPPAQWQAEAARSNLDRDELLDQMQQLQVSCGAACWLALSSRLVPPAMSC